jgi:hypothetical protein
MAVKDVDERDVKDLSDYLENPAGLRLHDWRVMKANARLTLALLDHLNAPRVGGKDFTDKRGDRPLDLERRGRHEEAGRI